MKNERKNKRRSPIYFGDTINLQKQRKIERKSTGLYALRETPRKIKSTTTTCLVRVSFSSLVSTATNWPTRDERAQVDECDTNKSEIDAKSFIISMITLYACWRTIRHNIAGLPKEYTSLNTLNISLYCSLSVHGWPPM